MLPAPDFVIDSLDGLSRVLAKDLPAWSAQIVMLSGSWMEKSVADSGLVTLELTTYGSKGGLLEIEKKVVEALENIDVKEIVTGDNQRGISKSQMHSYIFYRPGGKQ